MAVALVATDEEKRLLGRRLRAARERSGLTQQDLAEQAKTTVATVSQAERGVSMPSRSTRDRLAEALKVTYRWLSTGDGPMQSLSGPVTAEQLAELAGLERPEHRELFAQVYRTLRQAEETERRAAYDRQGMAEQARSADEPEPDAPFGDNPG